MTLPFSVHSIILINACTLIALLSASIVLILVFSHAYILLGARSMDTLEHQNALDKILKKFMYGMFHLWVDEDGNCRLGQSTDF